MNILFVCYMLTHGEKNQTADICSNWWILRIPCFAKEAKYIIACTVYSISMMLLNSPLLVEMKWYILKLYFLLC